jgi:hypothetical protein
MARGLRLESQRPNQQLECATWPQRACFCYRRKAAEGVRACQRNLAAQPAGSENHFHGVVCGSLGDATWQKDRVLPCRIRSQQPSQPVTFLRRACGSSETERVKPTEDAGGGGGTPVSNHHDDGILRQHERDIPPSHVHCHNRDDGQTKPLLGGEMARHFAHHPPPGPPGPWVNKSQK